MSESFVSCKGSSRFDGMPILQRKARKAAADDGGDRDSSRSFFIIILAGRPSHAYRLLRVCSRITRAFSPLLCCGRSWRLRYHALTIAGQMSQSHSGRRDMVMCSARSDV